MMNVLFLERIKRFFTFVQNDKLRNSVYDVIWDVR